MAFIGQDTNLPKQFFLPLQQPLLKLAVTQTH
jgi:hypothetical protein